MLLGLRLCYFVDILSDNLKKSCLSETMMYRPNNALTESLHLPNIH